MQSGRIPKKERVVCSNRAPNIAMGEGFVLEKIGPGQTEDGGPGDLRASPLRRHRFNLLL
jgi:hypothetical protein